MLSGMLEENKLRLEWSVGHYREARLCTLRHNMHSQRQATVRGIMQLPTTTTFPGIIDAGSGRDYPAKPEIYQPP